VGAPGIAVLLSDLQDVLLDQPPNLLWVGQQILQIGDAWPSRPVFVLDLLPFQRGQAAQLQVQDRLGLDAR
jgi:hypothetical protein